MPHIAKIFKELPNPAGSFILLERILSETPHPTISTNLPIVLYGRGKLGKLAHEYLEFVGHPPTKTIEYDEEANLNSCVAVCIVTAPYVPIEQKLLSRGFKAVVPFYDLTENFKHLHPLSNGWFAGDIANAKRKINKVLAAWEDDTSRAHHLQFLAWRRLRQEWSFNGAPLVPVEDRYFIPEICDVLHDNEVFLDCGAYTGEASLKMRKVAGPSTCITAIEPMPSNLVKLKQNLHNATIIGAALGRKSGIGKMFGDGMTAKLDARGETTIKVTTIDEMADYPTYIKAHLEGGEFDTLRGAVKTLTTKRPIVSVGAYHNADGLWRTAAWLMKTLEDYRFLFRLYCWCGCGAIIYAIPNERVT